MKNKLLLTLLFLSTCFLGYSQYPTEEGYMLTTPGGSGNYIDLGSTQKRNFGDAGNSFSVEFWFKEDDGSAELLGLDNQNFKIFLSSGTLNCQVSDGTNTTTLTSTSALDDNDWHHVAVTFKNVSGSNDSINLYIDLVKDASGVTSTFHPDLNNGQWYLATNTSGSSNTASASFDELRFWDDFRTKDEILNQTNDTLQLGVDDTTNLVGYFQFGTDTVTGTTIDSSFSNTPFTQIGTGFSYSKTTAPCPYFTIRSGSLFNDTTWAVGQNAPPIPNDYVRIWVRHEPVEIKLSDPDFIVGGFIVQYDTVGVNSTQTHVAFRRAPVYSFTPTIRDLVVKGPNYNVSRPLNVTRSMKAERHPGNCWHCGNAELIIKQSGRLNFTGSVINFNNATVDISGIMDIKSNGHTLNLRSTDITINNGGMLFSEATGSNIWDITGGSIIIEYGGAITKTSKNPSTILGNPNITMKHKFDPLVNNWRNFSSPNFGGDLSDYTDDLTLNFTSGSAGNVYYWDPSEDGSNPGYAVGWVQQTASSGNPNTTAYTIYSAASGFPVLDGGNIEYTGNVFSGDYTVATYNYYDPQAAQNSQNKGWNLIVNPYPGAIDIEKLVGDYNGDGSITDNVGTEFPFAYKGIHIWDANSGQYVATLPNGLSTYTAHDGFSLGSGHPTFIRPFTAFWIKMTDGDAVDSLTLQNPHRLGFRMVNGNNEYHKTNFKKLRLRVYDSDSGLANTLVVFDPQATDGWDVAKEAYHLKSMNPSKPSLYTLSSEGAQSIMSLDVPASKTHHIPVEVKAGVVGAHYLDYNHDEYDSNWEVWVVDSTTNNTHNLANGPYSFSIANAGDQRKLWILATANFIDVPEFSVQRLNVLNFENHWEIQNEKLIGGTLQVIDISGKLLSERPVLDSKTRIQKPETPGVYIIKYYGNNKVINTKVIR